MGCSQCGILGGERFRRISFSAGHRHFYSLCLLLVRILMVFSYV
ncbi:unnamed protein product [Brassica oleracea var. botrytis]